MCRRSAGSPRQTKGRKLLKNDAIVQSINGNRGQKSNKQEGKPRGWDGGEYRGRLCMEAPADPSAATYLEVCAYRSPTSAQESSFPVVSLGPSDSPRVSSRCLVLRLLSFSLPADFIALSDRDRLREWPQDTDCPKARARCPRESAAGNGRRRWSRWSGLFLE